MKNYFLKRILLIFPTLIGISLITFAVIHLSPGSPVRVNQGGMMSSQMSMEAIEKVRKMYGLNKPILVQYWDWLKRIVTLDFGNSFQDGRPVMERIKERLPITLTLNIISLFLIYLISIPIGVYSAKYNNKFFERGTTFFLFFLYSLPIFWVGLLLIIVFGVELDLLPIYGVYSNNFSQMNFLGKIWDVTKHMILPIITMTYGGLAYLSRFVKNGMVEVMQEDYIMLARAKGLPENKIIWKHSLRNALIPVITLFATTLPTLIGGSVIVESIFSIPGIGLLFYKGILARDYPLIMGLSFITAFLTLISLIIADFLYTVVDPRISFEKQGN